MAKGNDILPRYISTLCLDTIYKVYTFDNSDKSRAVQEDGLAGTSTLNRSSTLKPLCLHMRKFLLIAYERNRLLIICNEATYYAIIDLTTNLYIVR